MVIQIRQAIQEDALPLARFVFELNWFSSLEGKSLDQIEPIVQQQLELCLTDDSHSVFVAIADEQIIGYASVHWLPYLFLDGPEGFISECFVAEQDRGKGVGSQLLETIITEARERGCSRLELINFKQRESYQQAFYARRGWEERFLAANFIFRLE